MRSSAQFAQPTLIFQGLRDESVEPRTVEALRQRAAERDALAARRRSSADREPAADLGGRRSVPGAGRLTRARLRCCSRCCSVSLRRVGAASAPAQDATSGRHDPHRRAAERLVRGRRRCRSRPTSRACWPVRRCPAASPPRSRRWRSRFGPTRSAIAARHRADGFDLCDQTHCQVMRAATPVTERAALATAGQVLLYKRRAGDGLLQRVVRRAHREAVERLAGRRRSALSAVATTTMAAAECRSGARELSLGDLQRALRAAGLHAARCATCGSPRGTSRGVRRRDRARRADAATDLRSGSARRRSAARSAGSTSRARRSS